jgi:hypothetical protein
MRYSVLALAVAAGITASPAFAGVTNLITNGDFTDLTNGLGQITDGENVTSAVGWTTTGYNMVMNQAGTSVNTQYGGFTLWDHANGGVSDWSGLTKSGVGNFLAMDADYDTARVSQTVSGLTVGDTYDLTFNYGFAQQRELDGSGFNGATTQNLEVFVGDANAPAWTSATENLANHDFSGWSSETLTFTATASSEVVSFLAAGSPQVPPFTLVSDVSLIESAPELSTWAMMALGFAGLGYAGFRSARRRQGALA